MTFSGLPFLLGFLPLVLCGCALFGKAGDTAFKAWLVTASLLFYAIGAPGFLPLVIASFAGNYVLLRVMTGSPDAGRWATAGVIANLALLATFKFVLPAASFPLGLSFFTFTQIGCLLHHAGGDRRFPRPLDFALFAGFFAALPAGPVLNAGDVLPQLARSRWGLTTGNLQIGLGFFLIGLLKKTLLADPLAPYVAASFADPGGLTLIPAWQAACQYSLQLYFDFSGYTDMAIGLAWMVGLRFPDNFDQPYRARSVIDYWQRWHMSLTRFLMAHVHAPLTLAAMRWRRRRSLPIDQSAQRSAAGFATMIAAPILATMLLVALWHGDTAPFLVFGLLHTAFLLINHAWRLFKAPALHPVASLAITYVSVLVACVFFRAETLGTATSLIAGMIGRHGIAPPPHLAANTIWLVVLYAIVWFAPTTRQIMTSRGRHAWTASPRWAVVMGGAAALGVLAAGGTGEFLYFRF